ncbi:hypothetical protein CALCODRAFT_281176 [Calocera cornea HHB12733]|uniref:Uncharacterized protein n=1 Tax=Calocera cornea HHB12733 TaxID=1353952 RepID=A0A165G0Q2_9BASI|nr:hypothetical protein CALCODRAFT_281176 [Calocera cornea HHB12733]
MHAPTASDVHPIHTAQTGGEAMHGGAQSAPSCIIIVQALGDCMALYGIVLYCVAPKSSLGPRNVSGGLMPPARRVARSELKQGGSGPGRPPHALPKRTSLKRPRVDRPRHTVALSDLSHL